MNIKKILKKIEDWYAIPYKNINNSDYINIGGLDGVEMIKNKK
jgi:hypothetical protein